MKKVQAMDEAGRAMAQERYGEMPLKKSEHGHTHMDHDMKDKFETKMPKQGKGKASGGSCG